MKTPTDRNINEKRCKNKIEYAQIELESSEIYKIEISGKIEENDEKCKELFSKQPVFFHDIPISFSGYELEGVIIFITLCKDARFFSRDPLRLSRLLSYTRAPHISAAISLCECHLYIKAQSFHRLPECRGWELLFSSALAALEKGGSY